MLTGQACWEGNTRKGSRVHHVCLSQHPLLPPPARAVQLPNGLGGIDLAPSPWLGPDWSKSVHLVPSSGPWGFYGLEKDASVPPVVCWSCSELALRSYRVWVFPTVTSSCSWKSAAVGVFTPQKPHSHPPALPAHPDPLPLIVIKEPGGPLCCWWPPDGHKRA